MPVPILPSTGLPEPLIHEIQAKATSLTEELHELQLALHKRPEIAWKEHFAHDQLTAYMERQVGWSVERHACELPTAWKAVYEVGQGGPIIGFNSEMDALRGIGHACGHNQIAIAGVAAALATAHVLEKHDLPGKVVLLGTPAEEAGGGKAYMLKRGAYDGMEACLMLHPGWKGNGVGFATLACSVAFSVKYTGASAHAGGMPEKGINALDAAVAAYTNIALLRQQVPSSHKIFNTIKGSEGWTANVIASDSTFMVGMRTPTAQEATSLTERVLNCLRAAALATGCQFEIRRESMYMDLRNATELEDCFEDVCKSHWDGEFTVDRLASTAASDFGNIGYAMPVLHPMYGLPEAREGDSPHSNTFAESTGLRSSTDATIRAAAMLAVVGTRLIVDRPWATNVRAAWAEQYAVFGGQETVGKVEKLVSAYPLAPEVSSDMCSCGH